MKKRGFEEAVQFVLQWETVYAKGHWGDLSRAIAENDPDDPGGVTKFGIDARSHPNLDIPNLTLAQAKDIYYGSYWSYARCERWPFPIAVFLFDSAVNVGFKQATIWFQRLSRASVDGVWGPKTDEAVQAWLDDVGVGSTFDGLLECRRVFYRGLKRPKFEAGWLNRVTALSRFVGDARS